MKRYRILAGLLLLTPLAHGAKIMSLYYTVKVLENASIVLADYQQSSTPVPRSFQLYSPNGTNAKITFQADADGAFVEIEDTQAAGFKRGASAFSVVSYVEYTYKVQEIKPTPVPVLFVPLKSSYSIESSCGSTNSTELATSRAWFSLGIGDGSGGSVDCNSSKFGSAAGDAAVGKYLNGYFAAGADVIMRFDQDAGLAGGTRARASADPDIEIDPTFEYKDYFEVVSGRPDDITATPEPGSVWLCIPILLLLPCLRAKSRLCAGIR